VKELDDAIDEYTDEEIEEIVNEDIKGAIREEMRRNLVRIPLLIIRQYLLNLPDVEKIRVRRTGEPSEAMITFLKKLKLGVNDVRAIMSGEVAENLRNLKSSVDDSAKLLGAIGADGEEFRLLAKAKAMLDNEGAAELRTICRRFLREIGYSVVFDVYYSALHNPKGFEDTYSTIAVDFILDRIERLLKALDRPIPVRSSTDPETERLYEELVKIALGEKERILPPPDIHYSTTNRMYDRLVGIVRRLLLDAGISKYELPKYMQTDDTFKTITIGIPVKDGDGKYVVTIKFTERRWYVPPSKAEQHVRSALKAQREALNSRGFAVWEKDVKETCIVLVGSRYTRSVVREMKKKFDNPRRRVYVFTDYKWLYRLVKILHKFFSSRLEGLNRRLEEVKVKAYGVVKEMYELFSAYVDTLNRWLSRVRFVRGVLVYPD